MQGTDSDVQTKIDAVLDRVKDKQSGLTVAELGLVKKIRFVKNSRRMIICFATMGKSKACCSVLNMAILSDLEKALRDEFQILFPDHLIQFRN